jgi:hypothetical protein
MHDNQVERINPSSVYQYYNLSHLWKDLDKVLRLGLPLAHFATEPLPTAELAEAVFGRRLPALPGAAAARYDFRSRHADLFGGSDGYLYRKEQVLAELRAFVAAERQRRAA